MAQLLTPEQPFYRYSADPLPVPETVAVCPGCRAPLWVHVVEWSISEDDYGEPAEHGCEWFHGDFPGDCSGAWTYGQLIATDRAVYEWCREFVRVERR